jgi:hypothetical protein
MEVFPSLSIDRRCPQMFILALITLDFSWFRVLAPLQRRNTFVRIFPIVESWNSHLLYL